MGGTLILKVQEPPAPLDGIELGLNLEERPTELRGELRQLRVR